MHDLHDLRDLHERTTCATPAASAHRSLESKSRKDAATVSAEVSADRATSTTSPGPAGGRLSAYLFAVFVAGTAAWIWAWPHVDPLPAVAFVGGLALAELLPARVRDDVSVSLGNVVVLMAVLVGGPVLAITTSLGVLLAGRWLYLDRVLRRTLFNAGQVALSAASAGTVFVLVGGAVGAPHQVRSWLGLLAGAVAYSLVNSLLVAVAVRLSAGDRVRSTVADLVRSSAVLQLLYAGLSILAAALLVGVGPEALILLLVPALVARHALRGFQHEAESYDRLVSALLKAVEVRDGYTRGHTERVSELCVAVARELGTDYEELRAVRYAAKLHDVGKIAVPISVINKPGPLDDDEFELIKTHPAVGADILADIEFLRPALDGVRYHHERVDGNGYPSGVSGEELPMVARIITVCDAFDAMTSTRSYRPAMTVQEAFAELRRCAGTQFDGRVVDQLEVVTERLGWEPTYEFVQREDTASVCVREPAPVPA